MIIYKAITHPSILLHSSHAHGTLCQQASYLYPQREYPYSDLLSENARRGKNDPEYELEDTHALDDGAFWDVVVCCDVM